MLNIKTLCPSDLPICKTLFYGDITLGQHGATNSNNQYIHISLSRYVALQNQRNTDRKPHHLTYSERKYSGQNVITANMAMEIVKAFFNELFPIWAFNIIIPIKAALADRKKVVNGSLFFSACSSVCIS